MCRFGELRNKEIIDIGSGKRFGFVCDIEIDLHSGRITAIVVPCRRSFWNLFGKDQDDIIPWEDIKRIGDDIILVDISPKRLD